MPDDRSRIEVFRDRAGGWRFRAVAGNGEIVFPSSEAYTRRWGARRAARRFLPGWTIVNIKS